MIWLTVECGEPIGVTSEHPMFVVDAGRTRAEGVVAGDALRTASLASVLVLDVEVDRGAQRVCNLEVAKAGTYFVGDAEVWGIIPVTPSSLGVQSRHLVDRIQDESIWL
ncbi:hypothetical protein [Primorskyibacter sp. 2E233]|uniref:hypothetical protein n=1 Tax=Primorskyibacter sp. 2E233 TaxID=3413431 RepID=UPI003BF279CB